MILATLAAVSAGGTGAFFSDTETSTGNTFTAGAIDLKIDNTSYYNGVLNPDTSWSLKDLTIEKFFNFLDLKPGDRGEDTISLHVDTNDSYLCANVKLTSNDDNGLTEPESLVDTTGGVGEGELASEVNFVWWADDGDNVLETGETVLPGGNFGSMSVGSTTTVPLADSTTNIWSGSGPILGNTTKYIGKAWCFGTLTPAPLAQDGLGTTSPRTPANSTGGISCDGSLLGNETQTDSLTADISFTAVQSRNNPNFVCLEEVPPPPVLTACTDTSKRWMDSVVFVGQGKRKNGTNVLPDRSVIDAAFGPAESTGTPTDTAVAGSFFSLGFPAQNASSSVVLAFTDNIVLNGAGADLRVYEVTGGTYPDEHVKVEASKDGVNWTLLAADAVRDEDVDLGPLDWAKYVRITDITSSASFEDTADGYDLDAVEALNCGNPLVQ